MTGLLGGTFNPPHNGHLALDFVREIDLLCEKQRQKIDKFDEHLEFAQFWYELLGSKPARSYLAEYKAKQIGNQLQLD